MLSTNHPSSTSREPLVQPSETVLCDTAFLERARLLAREYVPRKPSFSDEDAEVDFYARSPFTAWEHALLRNRHHPKLWKVIKGSPYERLYRQRFDDQF